MIFISFHVQSPNKRIYAIHTSFPPFDSYLCIQSKLLSKVPNGLLLTEYLYLIKLRTIFIKEIHNNLKPWGHAERISITLHNKLKDLIH